MAGTRMVSSHAAPAMTLRPTDARVARDARLKLPIGTKKLNPVQFLGKSLSSSIIQSSESEESTLKAGQLGKRQYPRGLCQHLSLIHI